MIDAAGAREDAPFTPLADATANPFDANPVDARADGAGGLTQGGDESPCYHLNPAHTGLHRGGLLQPPLKQLWSVDLGAPVSSPVVAMGHVYDAVLTNPKAPKVVALDHDTGAMLWEARAATVPTPGLDCAYDEGKIFTSSWDGLISAFDAQTGAAVWSASPFYGFTSPPTPAGGILLVTGASDGTLAFDESSGKQLWANYAGSETPPALAGGAVFATSGCLETKVFDVRTGAMRWHYSNNCSGGGGETPVVFGSRVYVRDENDFGGVLELDAASGATAGMLQDSTLVPAFDGALGFFVNSLPRKLVARTLADGKESWSFDADGSIATEPIVVNGYVYVVTRAGRLYALDEQTGNAAWSDDIGYPVQDYGRGGVEGPRAGLAATDHILLIPANDVLVAYGLPLAEAPRR
jgi:outer membrane protein assembly factor BamB